MAENDPRGQYIGDLKGPDGNTFSVFMRKALPTDRAIDEIVPPGTLDAPPPGVQLPGAPAVREVVGPIEPITGPVEFIVPPDDPSWQMPPDVQMPQEDTTKEQPRAFIDKAMDDVLHGVNVMGAGLLDAALLPSKLIEPVVRSVIGETALTRGNKAWDDVRREMVGKDDKDYNAVENILHFGGQLVPTPGMVASTAKGAVPIAQRLFEAVTPLVPAKGLTTGMMAANVAVPTAIVEGADALKEAFSDNGEQKPAQTEQQRKQEFTQWMKDNQEMLLAAPLALATRGKYKKSLGIEGRAPGNVVTPAQRAETGLFDSNAQLTARLSERQTTRIQSTVPGSAMASRTLHAFKTGHMPSSSVRLQHVPAGVLEAWAKLPEDLRKTVAVALRAADDLDNRALGGTTVFPGVSDAELRRMVAAGRATPVGRRWMAAYNQTMQDVLTYMHERGLITTEKYSELLINQPNYVSRIGAENLPTGIGGMIGRTVEALITNEPGREVAERIIQQMTQRGAKGVDTYETLVDPAVALEQVIQNVIRFAEINSIRRSVLPTLASQKMGNGMQLAERVKSIDEANISVLVNGKREFWKVNDPHIAQAVQFAPVHAHMLVNNVRHAYQMATTGPVADLITTMFTGVPAQSIANAFYEAFGIMTQAYKGSKFNPADAILALPTGVAMALKARYYEIMARTAEDAILRGTPISNVLSPDAARAAADGYARTIVGTLERHGGALTAGTTTKEFEMLSTLSKHYAPTFYGQVQDSVVPNAVRSLVNNWYWAHDSVQMLWRYHYMYRNLPANATPAMEQEIANKVARVTGDFRQKGDMTETLSFVRDSQPYGNVALQSIYAFTRAFKDNPARVITALSSTALAYSAWTVWQMAENRDLATFYWNELTPEQRSQGIPVWQDPSNPRAVQFITLPHEPRPFISAYIEAFGTMSGFKDGSIYSQPEKLNALMAAFDKPWGDRDLRELRSGVGGALGQMWGDMPVGGGAPGAVLGALGMQWRGDRGLLPSPESKQAIEEGYEFTNDPHKRWVYDMLRQGLGNVGQLLVAADRGFSAVGDSEPLFDKFKSAWTHMAEVPKQRVQKLTGLLGADHRVTTQTTDFKLLQPKADKIDTITRVVGALAAGSNTDRDARGDQLTAPKDLHLTPEALAVAKAIPPDMWKRWRDARTERGRAYEQRDALQNAPTMGPEEKTRLTNEYNRAINRVNAQMLLIAQDMERAVERNTGKPFRFDDLAVAR